MYLGIRCSNNDFCYVILSGSSSAPKIEKKDHISFPKRFSRQQSLKWFFQEIEGILKKYPIKVIAIKGTEGNAPRGKAFVDRIENEAMIYLAAANKDIRRVYRKVYRTIATNFGLRGKAKYLSTKLDCSVFPGFNQENNKMKNAILVAWSSMP